MIEQTIDIATKDGATTTFICHPERGGPHPVILFYMDAPAIREELRDMVRRLASVGYYVMLPNLYYRSGVMELADIRPPLTGDALWPKMRELMASISIPLIMDDTDALIAFAEKQTGREPRPDRRGRLLHERPVRHQRRGPPSGSRRGGRVHLWRAADDRPADSPHLAAARGKAEIYIACAEIDHWAPVEMIEPLTPGAEDRAASTPRWSSIPKVEHGFAFPARAAYNKDAAERHWERLFALFRRRLG